MTKFEKLLTNLKSFNYSIEWQKVAKRIELKIKSPNPVKMQELRRIINKLNYSLIFSTDGSTEDEFFAKFIIE